LLPDCQSVYTGCRLSAEYLRLAQAFAISVLRDQRLAYQENFGGFTFTGFGGEKIAV
jgi:hypothetical protein